MMAAAVAWEVDEDAASGGPARAAPTANGGTAIVPISRHETWLMWTAAVLLAAAVVGIAAAHGALGAARNDDWAYYRITFDFVETGSFRLDNWTQTMLVGQSILAWPIVTIFGPSIAALQVTVAIAGSAGIVLAYSIIRRFLSRLPAALATSVVALGPIYGAVAASFMSDVPAFTFQMLALYCAVRAFERAPADVRWYGGSVAACFVAFSIRELSAAVIVAVAVVGLLRSTGAARIKLVGITLTGAAAMALLLVWRRSLPGGYPTVLGTSAAQLWRATSTLATVAVLIAPVLVLVSPGRVLRSMWRTSRLCLVVIPLVLLALERRQHSAFIGNYFTPDEVSGLLPGRSWKLMLLVGLLAEVGIAYIVVTQVVRSGPVIRQIGARATSDPAVTVSTLFAAVGVLGMLALVLTSNTLVIDRYLLPYLPFVAAAVLHSAARRGMFIGRHRRVVVVPAIGALALVGATCVDYSAASDGASWQAGQTLVTQGYEPEMIDAGYAWFGYHQTTPVVVGEQGEYPFYRGLFPESVVCVSVIDREDSTDSAEATVVAERTTFLGRSIVLVAIREPLGCSDS